MPHAETQWLPDAGETGYVLTQTQEGFLGSDDFNRADGAPGPDWEIHEGLWVISGNRLSVPLAQADPAAWISFLGAGVLGESFMQVLQRLNTNWAGNAGSLLRWLWNGGNRQGYRSSIEFNSTASFNRSSIIRDAVPDDSLTLATDDTGGFALNTFYPTQLYVANSLQQVWQDGRTLATVDAYHDDQDARGVGLWANQYANSGTHQFDDLLVCRSKWIRVTGLLPGWKVRITNAALATVVEVTEVGGAVEIDASRFGGFAVLVPLAGWPRLAILNELDEEIIAYEEAVYPGSTFELSFNVGGLACTPAMLGFDNEDQPIPVTPPVWDEEESDPETWVDEDDEPVDGYPEPEQELVFKGGSLHAIDMATPFVPGVISTDNQRNVGPLAVRDDERYVVTIPFFAQATSASYQATDRQLSVYDYLDRENPVITQTRDWVTDGGYANDRRWTPRAIGYDRFLQRIIVVVGFWGGASSVSGAFRILTYDWSDPTQLVLVQAQSVVLDGMGIYQPRSAVCLTPDGQHFFMSHAMATNGPGPDARCWRWNEDGTIIQVGSINLGLNQSNRSSTWDTISYDHINQRLFVAHAEVTAGVVAGAPAQQGLVEVDWSVLGAPTLTATHLLRTGEHPKLHSFRVAKSGERLFGHEEVSNSPERHDMVAYDCSVPGVLTEIGRVASVAEQNTFRIGRHHYIVLLGDESRWLIWSQAGQYYVFDVSGEIELAGTIPTLTGSNGQTGIAYGPGTNPWTLFGG